MALALGTRLGPFEIQALLGAGGMGEVYKARDTRLDLTVAIKILPPDVSGPDRRARFEREAKAIAGLNHPHVCTLYDVGEHGGSTFLVMELLEGESLREQLSRARPVVAAIIDTGIQLADALECAHAKGIVHRDIKPENVFLTTRGAAKLLDFGIAKLVGEQAAAALAQTATRSGTGPLALGTVAYMSPEQVRGDTLDARTDLFSLGVVLYEMATGTPPFKGTTSGAVLGEILTKAPTAPVRLNPDVPSELERIVNKLLEKDRALRYQSATDLRVDLERLRRAPGDAATPREQASIVVLPFENLSPDPDNAYFADGLTEEVIANLSRVRALRVISRTSAMRFKGTKKSLPEIAREVSVRHVLEGSVRRAGNNLRITAQLIDADTDGHLWADRYAGTLDDVFDIQEKVARAITDALQVRLSPGEQQRLAERPVSDARVLDCYQRAHREVLLFSAESFQRAVRLLEHGVETLGGHPLLYLGLAEAHYNGTEAGLESREEGLGKAAENTRRVVGADPRFAHALLGKQERHTGSLMMAIRHFEDAVAANPGDVESLLFLSLGYSCHAGKPAAGAAAANRLIAVDPLTAFNVVARGLASWMDADFTRALAAFDELVRREPNLRPNAFWRVAMLAALGRSGDACRAADALGAEDPALLWAQLALATKHALLHEGGHLRALVTGSLESYCWHDPDIPVSVAGWFALVNERELAFRWLEHWVDRGSINYPWLAHGDPFLEPLRREPRFQRLLDRIKPEWEAFVPRFEV
jgi:serine/threonine protein kinase